MVLAEGQTHRLMEQNRELQNQTHKCIQLLSDKGAVPFNRRAIAFSTNSAGAIRCPQTEKKNKPQPKPHIYQLYFNKKKLVSINYT